jgi:hypothetical protein
MFVGAEKDASDSGKALFPTGVYLQFPGLAGWKPIYKFTQINENVKYQTPTSPLFLPSFPTNSTIGKYKKIRYLFKAGHPQI